MKDLVEYFENLPDLVKAESLYDSPCEPCDYQPIVESFGEILIQVEDEDYSGDTRVLYKINGQYAYLIFGWGSCSGCDALQACESYEDINYLIEELWNSIQWFPTLESCQKWFRERDWPLHYEWHTSETKVFIEKVLAYG